MVGSKYSKIETVASWDWRILGNFYLFSCTFSYLPFPYSQHVYRNLESDNLLLVKTGENENSSISIQMKLGNKFTILEEMEDISYKMDVSDPEKVEQRQENNYLKGSYRIRNIYIKNLIDKSINKMLRIDKYIWKCTDAARYESSKRHNFF